MTEPEILAVLDKLKAWCGEKHGRQMEAAKAIGVSKQQINHWVKGRAIPSIGYWLQIKRFVQHKKTGG